jgi:hypothetical protein
MKTELATIVEQSGLERAKAESIWSNFEPYFKAASECSVKVNGLEITDVAQKKEMKLARDTRLKLKRIRVAAEKTKKELKDGMLKEGRFIDATFGLIANSTKPLEADLLEKENFAKRKEAEMKERLRVERTEALQPFGVDLQFVDLAKMTEEEFGTFLTRSRLKKERSDVLRPFCGEFDPVELANMSEEQFEKLLTNSREAHEAEVEKQRIIRERERRLADIGENPRDHNLETLDDAQFEQLVTRLQEKWKAYEASQKAAAEERARIEAENARLQAEAEERERQLAEERAKLETARKAAEDAARMREAAERAGREARDAAERAEREKEWAAIQKAREEAEAAQRALREKQEAEALAKIEEAARIEAQRKAEEEERKRLEAASDKEKLSAYFDQILSLEVPTVKSGEATGILALMHNCIQVCVSKIEKL